MRSNERKWRSIGKRIQEARNNYRLQEAGNYTQEKMAEQLRISAGYYRDIEQGYYCPSKWLLDDICAILGCKADYIMSGEDVEGDLQSFIFAVRHGDKDAIATLKVWKNKKK